MGTLKFKTGYDTTLDITETVDGQAYTHTTRDEMAGYQAGSLTRTYGDTQVIKYTGVVNTTTATSLASVSGLAGTGTAGDSVIAYSVSFDSEIGDPCNIEVSLGDERIAYLDVGENVIFPVANEAIAKCKILSQSYSSGTDEATVTARIIGVNYINTTYMYLGHTSHPAGSNQGINIANPTLTALEGETHVSYSLWHRFYDSGADNLWDQGHSILTKWAEHAYQGAAYSAFQIYGKASNEKIGFAQGNGTTTAEIFANNAATNAIWYHIVCVWDNSTIKMYINNVLQSDTASLSGGSFPDTQDILSINVGRSAYEPHGSGVQYGKGSYDGIVIYTRALNAADVANLYGGGSPATAGDPNTIDDIALWYKCEEGEDFPQDSSGNNYHITASGGTANLPKWATH